MSKNCNPFDETKFEICQEYTDRRSIVSVKDDRAKSQYILGNTKRNLIVKLRVDNCLIKGSDKRKCDFLILDCSDKIAYFIELKGGDLSGATDQIISTVDMLAPKLKNFQFCCRIIQTQTNRTTQTKYINKITGHLKEKHKANSQFKVADLIRIKSREYTELI
ncbi:hypothetical protein [Dyadobacter sp. CY356]|uniref:hypothetical protein n=1 Tax=Dyadobacter sp. CY356 TaxID=2906442 RepID=UPI001F1A1C74|nr:hypothetical protein [Dyadobacter sp. CY356]MCF0058227.1 hypothetical protein [Dyadobacter sp. CY356]